MIDFMKSISDWISANMGWFATGASAVLVGLPTLVSVARIMTNAKENKNYRGVTLLRILSLVGLLIAFVSEWLIEGQEDAQFAAKLKTAKRMCDLNQLGAEREIALSEREKRLGSINSKLSSAQDEFSTVPAKKGKR